MNVQITVSLTDDEVVALKAVRAAHGDTATRSLHQLIHGWIADVQHDPQVAELLRRHRRRGMRVVA